MLSAWLRDRIADARRGASRVDDIDLCVHEAVANVVRYGYRPGAHGTIAITVETVDRGLAVTITDDGQPFNPVLHPSPQLPRTIDEARDRGFGIHLMRSFTDELEYRRENEQNLLILRFRENDVDSASVQASPDRESIT